MSLMVTVKHSPLCTPRHGRINIYTLQFDETVACFGIAAAAAAAFRGRKTCKTKKKKTLKMHSCFFICESLCYCFGKAISFSL